MGTLSVQPPSGASRSLTEVFILLRNNAVQTRHIFADPGGKSEDRMSLVPLNEGEDRDVEAGMDMRTSRIPPEWVNMVDEVQYEMSRIRTRLKDLKDCQQKHLIRPSFNDDSSEEERAIAATTQDITKMLAHCQRLLQHIQQTSSPKRRGDKYLLKNVITSLLQALQQLTTEFRSSQTGYLRQVQNRDDSFQHYFEAFSADDSTPSRAEGGRSVVLDYAQLELEELDRGEVPQPLTMAQIQALEENTTMVKDREREILQVTKSILEINQLFKDLASFVVDQGTVLDRIDFNIEQSNIRVKAALKSVKKAEQYQKKSRKMLCIVILSAVIVFLFVILIIVKS